MAAWQMEKSSRARRYVSVVAMMAAASAPACTDGSESQGDRDDKSEEQHSEAEGHEEETEKPAQASKDAGTRQIDAGTKDAPSAESATGSKGSAQPDAGGARGASSAGWCDAKVVIDKYCTSCHDGEGTSGSPMGLVNAADFAAESPRTPGKKVFESVALRIQDTAKPMPPKAKLSADELATLDAWLAAGAPAEGDSSCVGSSETTFPDGRVDGWDPAKCDAIYELRAHGPDGPETPYVVPAGAEIHPQISVDAPWGDEAVQAIAFRPITDNKKVTHHWILGGGGSFFIAGWAPGDDQRPPLPDDVAIEMPSGKGAFNFDFHYHNLTGGQDEPDRSGVEVCVLKREHFRPRVAGVTGSFSTFGDGFVLAPAGANNAPTTGVCEVTAGETIHVLTRAPHAHKYATHMKFWVKKKDGSEIVMHDQPFAFGEQGTYPVEGGEVLLETGDTVYTSCYYTNSTSRNITFGESTEDEMCFNFALYYPKGALSCGGGGLVGGLGGLSGVLGGP